MSDWKVDIGFNTDELKAATSGASGGAGAGAESSGGGFGGFAKAVKAGLMATGLIGILANLKVILEIVGFAIAAISSMVGLLVVKFLEWFGSSQDEQDRSLLQLGITINNGILTGVEWLANALRSVFTLGQQGLGTDKQFEIGRFQEEIILESYDNLAKVEQQVKDGTLGFEQLAQAQKDYSDSWFNSFLTTDEFDQIKQLKEVNNETFANIFGLLETTGLDVNQAIELGSTSVINSADAMFTVMSNTFQTLKERAESLAAKERYESKFDNLETKGNNTKSWFDNILDFGSSFIGGD